MPGGFLWFCMFVYFVCPYLSYCKIRRGCLRLFAFGRPAELWLRFCFLLNRLGLHYEVRQETNFWNCSLSPWLEHISSPFLLAWRVCHPASTHFFIFFSFLKIFIYMCIHVSSSFFNILCNGRKAVSIVGFPGLSNLLQCLILLSYGNAPCWSPPCWRAPTLGSHMTTEIHPQRGFEVYWAGQATLSNSE